MKKIIILTAITSSLLFSDVYYKNKNEKNNYKSDSINFNRAKIFNIRQYRDYFEITIATKEHGRIRTKDRRKFKIGSIVSGSCSNYEYGEYKSCTIW